MKNLQFSQRAVPVAILLLCGIAFGPFIAHLGYYWDDWSLVMAANLKGDFWEFFTYNRPFSAWTYAVTFPILGLTPLNWHLFAEGMWALTVLAFWGMLIQLWPTRKKENAAMALLFAVHPAYLLHPIAVTLSQQYLTYLPFFLSMGAMLAAIRNPRRFWPLTILALATNFIHAFTMEYFWGLELLRPVLIWLIWTETVANRQERAIRTLKTWLPYLVVTGAAVLWRMFFVKLAATGDPNELVMISEILNNPISGSRQFLQRVVNDFVHLLFVRWYETVQLAWFDLGDRFFLFVWGVAGSVGLTLAFFFKRMREAETDRGNGVLIGVGLFAMFLGGMSAWAVGRQLTAGLYADRYALPPLLGAVMFMVGVIGWGVRASVKPYVLAALLSLSVATQLRVQSEYRWDWVDQKRSFWQLSWRAPGLADHTAVMSDGSLFRYTGGYLTGTALNVLYPPYPGETEDVSYWFFELDEGYFRYLQDMKAGPFPMLDEMRQYRFAGTSQEIVLVYYAPEEGNCLWVIREADQFKQELPALIQEAIPLSNLARILPEAGAPPITQVFGAEPAHTWCYFYQKAELARQQEDWAAIVALAKERAAQGFSPNNRLEWLPFVEAFAHTGDWEQALELSVDALKYSKSTRNLFCPVWRGFEQEGLEAPAGVFAEAYERLECEGGGE